MKPYAVIILAAGYSSRMKKFKPLLPLGDKTIIEHVISMFLSCGVDTYVVAGYRGEDIKAVLKGKPVTVVDNPDYAKGMFSSVRAGVAALDGNYMSFFVMPVDIPLVKPSTIQMLQASAAENPDKIIYPVFEGKRGHPPLIPMTFAEAILQSNVDGNLKAVLESDETKSYELAVEDKNILLSLDTPADYEKALKSLRL